MADTISKLDIILLVEDDPDHAELIIKALKRDGHLLNEIKWVQNGQGAIDYLTQTGKYNTENAPRPGLVLLDIKLPRKNGFQVLQEIKSDDKLKTFPVVMLTTTSVSDDVEKALKLGANDYIVKPVRFQEFVDKVKGVGHYWAFISDSQIAKEEYDD
ncbi:response regulator [bacterium]|nr:response regulator [bacterium]